MPRTVFCTYLQRDAEGLDRVPYPGELGQRIYANISKEAWAAWVRHQTMLMNEYRLTPIDPKARKFLVEEMEKFLFGGGAQQARGLRRSGTLGAARAGDRHASSAQAAMNDTPPSGATMPSQRGAPAVIR